MDGICPHYQPIISLADGRIIGHEVLGRSVGVLGLESLGGFFSDSGVDRSQKVVVDRHIRRQALQYAVQIGYTGKLFLNIKPEWILAREGEYPTIAIVKELGFQPSGVVIEITEDVFGGELCDLSRRIHAYREAGFQIAIDDFHFHHMDRLLSLRPDIVKMDRSLVAELAVNRSTRNFVEYIAGFAADSGISVLFEGVETEAELEAALFAGAELAQGFLFSRASPELTCDAEAHAGVVLPVRRNVHDARRIAVEVALHREGEIDALLASLLLNSPLAEGDHPRALDVFLHGLIERLPEDCYRLYICDGEGRQISSNVERWNGEVRILEGYRGRNWSFRPYFIENIYRMIQYGHGTMSRPYVDSTSRLRTRTFTRALNNVCFVFVDVRDRQGGSSGGDGLDVVETG